ncbi:hypothetical protein MRB53_041820 [Persea americana]|nr:hypothetical protein MRB53_041820 [Persea americana]
MVIRHSQWHRNCSQRMTRSMTTCKNMQRMYGNPFMLYMFSRTVKSRLFSDIQQIHHLVCFEQQVQDVHLRPRSSNVEPDSWAVTTKALHTGITSVQYYDAIIVSNGHYTTPFIPSIPGLAEFHKQHPHHISHSKHFRRPEDFRNKTVLTVGTGPSGSDIASQIAKYATPPLLYSSRSHDSSSTAPFPDAKAVPAIAAFLPDNRTVRFADESESPPLDAVVFCTGYLYTYPFLRSLSFPTPSSTTTDATPLLPYPEDRLITTGQRVRNVYKHIFYAPHPSLAFLVLPWNIVPFPLAEVQSAVIARVWSGRLSLPSLEDMRAWERQETAKKGDGKEFHRLPGGEDVEYIQMLGRWCSEAEKMDGDEGGEVGKEPFVWGKKEAWVRSKVGEIKKAFFARGDARKDVRTLEELGFVYDDSVQT